MSMQPGMMHPMQRGMMGGGGGYGMDDMADLFAGACAGSCKLWERELPRVAFRGTDEVADLFASARTMWRCGGVRLRRERAFKGFEPEVPWS